MVWIRQYYHRILFKLESLIALMKVKNPMPMSLYSTNLRSPEEIPAQLDWYHLQRESFELIS
jgi:hypothetical protein